jgi:hypothetical protein
MTTPEERAEHVHVHLTVVLMRDGSWECEYCSEKFIPLVTHAQRLEEARAEVKKAYAHVDATGDRHEREVEHLEQRLEAARAIIEGLVGSAEGLLTGNQYHYWKQAREWLARLSPPPPTP